MAHPVKPFKFGPLQRKWLYALTHGKYRQGVGALVVPDSKGLAYCCLGVANVVCELGEKNESSLRTTYAKLGLKNRNGSTVRSDPTAADNLTLRNDGLNGHRRHTFKEIAALLRAHPRRYFTRSA